MAALNWTMLDAKNIPVPLPDEETIMTINEGVEITLLVPRASPAAVLGGAGDILKELGALRLTDQRLIFLTRKTVAKPSFESLSIQLYGILSTQYVQPYFGSNHLVMELKPAPEGGLTEHTKAEIRFKDKPMFEFVNILEKARERSLYRRRQAVLEDAPPMYSTTSPSTPVEQNAGEAPPGYDV